IIAFDFPPFAALIVAIIGNSISVLLFIYFGAEINKLFHTMYHKFRKKDKKTVKMNPRMKRTYNRFEETGVCFLSWLLSTSQFVLGTISTIGAPRSQVFIWTNLGVGTLAVIMATLSVMAEELVSSFMHL